MPPNFIVRALELFDWQWESYLYSAWILIISAVGVARFIRSCRNAQSHIQNLPLLERHRLHLSFKLATGAIIYFASIHAFSEALKRNNGLWIIFLGIVACGYHLTVSSVIALGRTVLNKSLFIKCCHLLHGPTLIGCAVCCLINRQHNEEWVFVLAMIASSLVGKQISNAGYRRVLSNNEPRWCLFKWLELFVGGCLQVINGIVLIEYSKALQLNQLLIVLSIGMILSGFRDIFKSRKSFQEYFEIEEPEFNCIFQMIAGLFLSIWGFAGNGFPLDLSRFQSISINGIGLMLIKNSVMEIPLLPEPVLMRTRQRVLGLWLIVYPSLIAAGAVYKSQLLIFQLMLPCILFGIHLTYIGFRRMPQV